MHAALGMRREHSMPRFQVTISSHSGQAMVDLVRRHKILVEDHGARRNDEVGFLVHAIATDDEIDLLRGAGYVVETRAAVDGPS
jgi:hypothetical protein